MSYNDDDDLKEPIGGDEGAIIEPDLEDDFDDTLEDDDFANNIEPDEEGFEDEFSTDEDSML